MFNEIEKEYRKGLQHKRFSRYYWPRVVLVVILALLAHYLLWVDQWIVYACALAVLLILILAFFARELRDANKTVPAVNKSHGIKAKLRAYDKADDKRRVEALATDLAKHKICTKDDLKVAIDYYQSRLPRTAKPNFLEWFLTTVITSASIILVTYNDEAGSVNLHALEIALVAAAYFLTPFALAKIISTAITVKRDKLETILIEDLAYIFVHFDKYQPALAGE